MRITVALPSVATTPLGDFKVLYEHANGLAARGHDVTLIHPRSTATPRSGGDRARSLLWSPKMKLRGLPPTWFELDPRVEVKLVRTLDGHCPADADARIATAWTTANWIAGLPRAKGEGFYFVQDFEYREDADPGTRRALEATYRLGLRHIAISAVVAEMLRECGAEAEAVIPPAIDQSVFRLREAVEGRPRDAVVFPLRREAFKGTGDAIDALALASSELSRPLDVRGFGGYRPDRLPEWVTIVEVPTDARLAQLLNSSSIFVLPSRFEGFGLTGLEAMACGAAVVAADSGGVREYVRDGVNALLVPPGEPAALAQAITRLVSDDSLRMRLAVAGAETAAAYRWRDATESLERLLMSAGRSRSG